MFSYGPYDLHSRCLRINPNIDRNSVNRGVSYSCQGPKQALVTGELVFKGIHWERFVPISRASFLCGSDVKRSVKNFRFLDDKCQY